MNPAYSFFSLFLFISLVLSCTYQPTSKPNEQKQVVDDWGEYIWNIGEPATDQISIHLTAKYDEMWNRHLVADIKITSDGICRRFIEELDKTVEMVRDEYQRQWVFVRPIKTPVNCTSAKNRDITISTEDIESIYAGDNRDLTNAYRYELSREDFQKVPNLKVFSSLGTRSLFVFSAINKISEGEGIGAIFDLERRGFSGFFLGKNLLFDRGQIKVLKKSVPDSYFFDTIHLDVKDRIFKQELCRLRTQYSIPAANEYEELLKQKESAEISLLLKKHRQMTEEEKEEWKKKTLDFKEHKLKMLQDAVANMSLSTELCP